jgi:hypothetical protein
VRNKLQRPLHERVLTCQKQSARRKKDKRQESAFAARSSAFLISPSHRNLTLLFKTFKKQINVRPAMSAFASLGRFFGLNKIECNKTRRAYLGASLNLYKRKVVCCERLINYKSGGGCI